MKQSTSTRTRKAAADSPRTARRHPEQACLLPVEDRKAAGKALRERCTRSAHGHWKAPARRADPIGLLLATLFSLKGLRGARTSDKGRLPELIPIRYGRMLASPFTFYRGAAAVMAHDLAGTPATGLRLQACGDCHLLNFGGFATPERRAVFDINDFDETAVAHWEWDVKRLAASFVLAGRSNGFSEAQGRERRHQIESTLAECETVVDLLPPGTDAEDLRSLAFREQQYRRLAACLAQRSDILVAILRRENALRPGGTAEVVDWRRHPQHIPPEFCTDPPPAGEGHRLVVIDPALGYTSAD